MIMKITPKKDSNLESILLCDALYIHEMKNARIVPLFGPNGIGKSSVIKAILDALNKRSEIDVERTPADMRVLRYRNSKDNMAVKEAETYHESFDPNFLLGRMNARRISEGQSILYSVIGLFNLIGTGKNSLHYEGQEILAVFDEIDSGLSIDNLDVLMRKLRHTSRMRHDVQVIFSFNNPYVVNYFPQVLSLYDGHPLMLHTPKDMLNAIEENKEKFRKYRYYVNGLPKVPD